MRNYVGLQQEQKLMIMWSMIHDREHKSNVELYPATRDALRRSLSAKIFRSAFRFKSYDCGNNGWIHKSRCKSSFHVSERSTFLNREL